MNGTTLNIKYGLTSNHRISSNSNMVQWDLKEEDILEILLDLHEKFIRFTLIKPNNELDENPFVHVSNVRLSKYRLALSGLMCKSSEFALVKSCNQ